MKLGKEKLEALRAEITGELRPGQDVIVTHWIALSGTRRALENKYEELSLWFSENFLRNARRLTEELHTEKAWRIASENGARALYALGEGGVLAGLWKMAEAGGSGLSVQLRKIPIRQETIEICERLDINPYQLSSGGALLIGTENGTALVQKLLEHGIPACIIGQAVEGNDRLLHNEEHIRYLDRPQKDESYKVTR